MFTESVKGLNAVYRPTEQQKLILLRGLPALLSLLQADPRRLPERQHLDLSRLKPFLPYFHPFHFI